MIKLINIANKKTEGVCDAMRCTKPSTTEMDHPTAGTVKLCDECAVKLSKWYAQQGVNGVPHVTAVKDEETLPLKGNIGTLEPVPNSPALVRPTDTIKTHLEQARELLDITNNFEITDQESYSAADEVLAIVHQGEKDLKAEKEKAKKPLRETGKVIDSWFKEPLELYKEAKQWLRDRMSSFRSAQKEKQDLALANGDHEIAQQCAVEASDHTRVKTTFDYAVLNDGVDLPLEFLVPDETKNDEIVCLLPRNLLRPNYDLISSIVKEHGEIIEIPGIMIIKSEDLVMKGGPRCKE